MENTLQTWMDDEAARRLKVAPAGVAEREQLRGHSGLEFLQKIGDGELPPPPIAELMGFVPIEVEHGRIVFQGTPGKQHYNPSGAVHGGYAATLLDSAVGCAVHSTLPAGSGFTTLELKINYVRAMTDRTGPVRAEGKVIQAGKQVAIAEGRITDATGKLYAHATTTCLIFSI
ncbi:PaaI family thioesterase [Pseudoduganella sp. RAF53_2]|uniref:PaaI family thioesterase n=1 Tax=unclassified Pseudoduganella TaxID=2637179 RepID=UPI003F9D65B6